MNELHFELHNWPWYCIRESYSDQEANLVHIKPRQQRCQHHTQHKSYWNRVYDMTANLWLDVEFHMCLVWSTLTPTHSHTFCADTYKTTKVLMDYQRELSKDAIVFKHSIPSILQQNRWCLCAMDRVVEEITGRVHGKLLSTQQTTSRMDRHRNTGCCSREVEAFCQDTISSTIESNRPQNWPIFLASMVNLEDDRELSHVLEVSI